MAFFESFGLAAGRRNLFAEIWTPYVVFQYESNSVTTNIIPCWCGVDAWYLAIMPTSVYHILGEDAFLELVNGAPPHVYYHHVLYLNPPTTFYGVDAAITGHSEYGHPNVSFVNPNRGNRFFEAVAAEWYVVPQRYVRIFDWLREGLPVIEQTVEIARKLLDATKEHCAKEIEAVEAAKRREDLYKALIRGVWCAKASRLLSEDTSDNSWSMW